MKTKLYNKKMLLIYKYLVHFHVYEIVGINKDLPSFVKKTIDDIGSRKFL